MPRKPKQPSKADKKQTRAENAAALQKRTLEKMNEAYERARG